MSINDKLQQAQKSEHAQKSGEWFKLKEGDNTIRILTELEVIFEDFKKGICYTDCGFTGTTKGLAWVLDKSDNQVKLMKINYNLMKTIGAWETDEDYGFNGYPMPYDIKIKAEGAGTKEVKYTYLPKPVSPISDEVLDDLKSQKPISEIVQIMKEKNIEKHKSEGTYGKFRSEATNENADTIEYPTDEIAPEDIPF